MAAPVLLFFEFEETEEELEELEVVIPAGRVVPFANPAINTRRMDHSESVHNSANSVVCALLTSALLLS